MYRNGKKNNINAKVLKEEFFLEKQKIDLYLVTNSKYFESTSIPIIKQRLEKLDDDSFLAIHACELKDPTTILIISIFLGSLGIDRFMIGDIGMGILKLLTGGCCGLLTIIDWFTIVKKTKQKNLATLFLVI